MRHLYFMTGILGFIFLAGAAPAGAYDIKTDYCGVIVNFQYCKCAFHNQYCGEIKLSRSAANAYINRGYAEWACGKEGKTWTNGVCVTPSAEPAVNPEPVERDADKAAEKVPTCDASKHLRENAEGACACEPLYAGGTDDPCTFMGARGVNLSPESATEFQETIERLGTDEGTVFEGKDLKGNIIRIGVLREPDGSYVFTSDGYHFFKTAEAAVRPGLWSRVKTGWGDLWTSVGGWFGIGTYAGRDTANDPDKQRRGQEMLDASTQALKALLEAADDPESQFDTARETFEVWPERAKNYYEGKSEDLFHDAISSATGVDSKLVKNFVTQAWDEIGNDQLDALKKGLLAFPAETIKTLSTELKRADFAKAADAYATERASGKKPEALFALLLQGELPEIEALQLRGASQAYTKALLFTAYENAYQRYLLRERLR